MSSLFTTYEIGWRPKHTCWWILRVHQTTTCGNGLLTIYVTWALYKSLTKIRWWGNRL